MKANLVEIKRYKIACPNCGEATSSFSHLKPGQKFGPWFCGKCCQGYDGVIDADGHPDITPNGRYRKLIRTLVLLELPELIYNHPVYFVVFGSQWLNKKDEALSAGDVDAIDQYYYEEHTCPKNWLRCHVVHGESDDPHGLFRHVQTIPVPTTEQLVALGLKVGIDISWVEEDEESDNSHIEMSPHVIRTLFSRSYPNNHAVTIDGEVKRNNPQNKQIGNISS